ncbi:unnamed protein product, partial [Prunus brigantina]
MLMLGISIEVAFNVTFANWSSTYHSLPRYSGKSFNEGLRNMEERDNDEEGSRKAVGIGVQTLRWVLIQ